MAKAYCDNKDVFIRSMAETPHVQIIDSTMAAGGAEGGAAVSYEVQNNAGVEVWQSAQQDPLEEKADDDCSYDEGLFLNRVQEIAADIRSRAPNTLYIEWDVNPWSSPPQANILETFRSNGFKTLPGHESQIVAGDLATLRDSLEQSFPGHKNPHKLSVRRMATVQHGTDFGLIFQEAYSLPSPVWAQQATDCCEVWATRDKASEKWLSFVGYHKEDGDKPAVILCLCVAAGVVGIHAAGTRPQYQKQGLFQEMLYSALTEHLPKTSTSCTRYVASARSTSATFFQTHGAVPVAKKVKFLV